MYMHLIGCRNIARRSEIDVYTDYEAAWIEPSKRNCFLAVCLCESSPRCPYRDPAIRSTTAAGWHKGDAIYPVASPDTYGKHLAGESWGTAWARQHNSHPHARAAAKERMDSDETWSGPPRGPIDSNHRRKT